MIPALYNKRGIPTPLLFSFNPFFFFKKTKSTLIDSALSSKTLVGY
jgi:hypothetical protein